ncbi:hypothetical protein OIV83_005558 [Microbotryomycetes sp. JL201]|nr:hypothetical protein OIV83_005558 [Microbotryomycetes sp. JL201]
MSSYAKLGGYPSDKPPLSAVTARRSLLRRPAVILPLITAVLFVIALASRPPPSSTAGDSDDDDIARSQYSLDDYAQHVGNAGHAFVQHAHELGGQFGNKLHGWRTHNRKPPLRSGLKDSEFGCDPFASMGRLHVNLQSPTDNVWTPYDKRCKPSTYLNALYRPPGDDTPLIPDEGDLTATYPKRAFLPWFRNKTIVLHGDSIDRYHLKDFCEFVGGKLELVTTDHDAAPRPYKLKLRAEMDASGDETAESIEKKRRRREQEDRWERRPREGQELTNPWVCDVAEYGTTLVNVFNFGLQGAEEYFETERWYHPPATWVDRLHHITVPLLEKLARHFDRPEIAHPDLIEINSGYWDLRKYTEEDFTAAGYLSRPYPEDSPIPYTNLSPQREATWEREARKAIKDIARAFPGRNDGVVKNGPIILWRTLHHPPRHNYAPFPRVFALDSLARSVISSLQQDSIDDEDGLDLGLGERLRIDESGALMLGQEHHFRDLLHPNAVPGSWLWANVLLYELKRAVLRVAAEISQDPSKLDQNSRGLWTVDDHIKKFWNAYEAFSVSQSETHKMSHVN